MRESEDYQFEGPNPTKPSSGRNKEQIVGDKKK